MIRGLIRTALRYRIYVLALAIVILGLGSFVMMNISVDVFPDLDRPRVTVLTEVQGMAPQEVEQQVTVPLERVLMGVPGVWNVRSKSTIGVSTIKVEFRWGTDIRSARKLVQEQLRRVRGDLPETVNPLIMPISSVMGEIMLVGVTSSNPNTSMMELREIADWRMRPEILSVPGISTVTVMGGDIREYRVSPDPQLLQAYDISLSQVTEAARASQKTTGGAFMKGPHREALIRNLGRTTNIDNLAKTVVAHRNGDPIQLNDIGDVKFAPGINRGTAGVNGQSGVILIVKKQPGVDTLKLTEDIESILNDTEGSLPDHIDATPLYRQADFINTAVSNVTQALRDGTLIVVLVLFVFLVSYRATLLTLLTIPFSFLVTLIVFYYGGFTINTMTLGGLAVAVGLVVDDAIVCVENVFQRLRQNRQADDPRPVLRVILDAIHEVLVPVLYSSIMLIGVFLPLFFLSGIGGRLFAPIAVATIVSIAASTVIALTLIPVLSSYLLPGVKQIKNDEDGWLVRNIKSFDRKWILAVVLDYPKTVVLSALIIAGAAGAIYPYANKEFLPDFNEGTMTIGTYLQPGSSLEEATRIGKKTSAILQDIPEVTYTGRRTGRPERGEHIQGSYASEYEVGFSDDGRPFDQLFDVVRKRLNTIPGLTVSVGQPISHRLDHMVTGIESEIAIKIFGPDFNRLRKLGLRIEEIVKSVPGTADVRVEQQRNVPQVNIETDREAAAAYGVTPMSLNRQLKTALGGRHVAEVIDGNRRFDIVVRFPEKARNNLKSLRDIPISISEDKNVPLAEVARVRWSEGPNEIQRENLRRRIVVMSNTGDRATGTVVNEIQQTLNNRVDLPRNYSLSLEGQFEAQQEAFWKISGVTVLVFLLILLILYGYFGHWLPVAQVLLMIPLGFTGGLVLSYLVYGSFSAATLVGLITIAGIASRNTLLMLTNYLYLIQKEGMSFGREMIVRGSLQRLVPVTMSAMTSGLALMPLIWAMGEPGKEILSPVAVVVVGGLMTTTILDMIVTPTIFYNYGEKAANTFLSQAETDELDRISVNLEGE